MSYRLTHTFIHGMLRATVPSQMYIMVSLKSKSINININNHFNLNINQHKTIKTYTI